jgi:hypothetical protein
MLASVIDDIDSMAGVAEVVPATAASLMYLMPEPTQLDPTVAYM